MSSRSPADGSAELLNRWFDAFNAHDISGLLALADPEIDVHPTPDAESVPAGTRYFGHDGLRTLMEATFERFPDLKVDYIQHPARSRRVLVDLKFILDGENSLEVCAEYGIRDGRVQSIVTLDGDTVDGRAELSPREREVLSLLATGRTIAEIAEQLVLSELTVRTHVRNARERLDARTTAHAIALAVEAGALD